MPTDALRAAERGGRRAVGQLLTDLEVVDGLRDIVLFVHDDERVRVLCLFLLIRVYVSDDLGYFLRDVEVAVP